MSEPAIPILNATLPEKQAVANNRTVWIAVNGILNFPGDSKNWNLRFGVWLDLNGPDTSRSHIVEYFCGPIGRAFGQTKRCLKLMQLLGAYEGWDIKIIGHSNGTAVVLKALALAGWPKVSEVHLVCGACESDFDKNGLNAEMRSNRIGHVYVYVAGKDKALKFCRHWAARLLGYGTLGYTGPLNVAAFAKPPFPERVTVIQDGEWKTFGHSSCWQEQNFDATCRLLTHT